MPSELHKVIPPYKPKGKEEYMNARQLAYFRHMLEEMKRELLATMNVEEDALRTLARTRAEQVHEQLVGEGKLPDERVFLTDVDLAPSEDHEKVQSRLNITAGS